MQAPSGREPRRPGQHGRPRHCPALFAALVVVATAAWIFWAPAAGAQTEPESRGGDTAECRTQVPDDGTDRWLCGDRECQLSPPNPDPWCGEPPSEDESVAWVQARIGAIDGLLQAGFLFAAIATIGITYWRTRSLLPVLTVSLLAGVFLWMSTSAGWWADRVSEEGNQADPEDDLKWYDCVDLGPPPGAKRGDFPETGADTWECGHLDCWATLNDNTRTGEPVVMCQAVR